VKETACCRDTTVSSYAAKVRGEVFAHFQSVAVEVTAVCGTGGFTCQDELIVDNPIDVKENGEHALRSLVPSQPIKWVPGTLSLGVKRQEREADHTSTIAEVKKVYLYISSLMLFQSVVLSYAQGQRHLFLQP
jgi:hypothetical protein